MHSYMTSTYLEQPPHYYMADLSTLQYTQTNDAQCDVMRHPVGIQENPLASLPAYKLRVLENPHVQMIDHFPVDESLRARLDVLKAKVKVEEMISATTQEYMSMIEVQAQHKEQAMARLKAHEQLVENTFAEYEGSVQHELEECISYVQSVVANPSDLSKAWMASNAGQEAWRTLLQESQDQRVKCQNEVRICVVRPYFRSHARRALADRTNVSVLSRSLLLVVVSGFLAVSRMFNPPLRSTVIDSLFATAATRV
jgi:hypothetical protein